MATLVAIKDQNVASTDTSGADILIKVLDIFQNIILAPWPFTVIKMA